MEGAIVYAFTCQMCAVEAILATPPKRGRANWKALVRRAQWETDSGHPLVDTIPSSCCPQFSFDIFKNIRELRNKVVHARVSDLTESQALEYESITRRLASVFEKLSA
jgi:hypothetical protein